MREPSSNQTLKPGLAIEWGRASLLSKSLKVLIRHVAENLIKLVLLRDELFNIQLPIYHNGVHLEFKPLVRERLGNSCPSGFVVNLQLDDPRLRNVQPNRVGVATGNVCANNLIDTNRLIDGCMLTRSLDVDPLDGTDESTQDSI